MNDDKQIKTNDDKVIISNNEMSKQFVSGKRKVVKTPSKLKQGAIKL